MFISPSPPPCCGLTQSRSVNGVVRHVADSHAVGVPQQHAGAVARARKRHAPLRNAAAAARRVGRQEPRSDGGNRTGPQRQSTGGRTRRAAVTIGDDRVVGARQERRRRVNSAVGTPPPPPPPPAIHRFLEEQDEQSRPAGRETGGRRTLHWPAAASASRLQRPQCRRPRMRSGGSRTSARAPRASPPSTTCAHFTKTTTTTNRANVK